MTTTTMDAFAAARAAFIGAGERPWLRELAEEHDLSYSALRRVAKVQRWEHAWKLARARDWVARSRAHLEEARVAAVRSAARLLKLAKRPTTLRALNAAARDAHHAAGEVDTFSAWLAEGQMTLQELATGRKGRGDKNALSLLDRLGWSA